MRASVTRGRRAESQALEFLRRQGLALLARNYRCRAGELDLVMQEQETIVVAEVRYRRSDEFGSAADSVDWRKQGKLTRAALHFVGSRPELGDRPMRFDVLAISEGNGGASIEWIKDAFQIDC